MRVRVVLHGHLRNMADPGIAFQAGGALVMEAQEHTRVADLLNRLGLLLRDVGFVACNGITCSVESELADGDEVAAFPIMAGG